MYAYDVNMGGGRERERERRRGGREREGGEGGKGQHVLITLGCKAFLCLNDSCLVFVVYPECISGVLNNKL